MRFAYQKENSEWAQYVIPTIEVVDVLEKHATNPDSMRSIFSSHGQGGGRSYRRIIDVVKIQVLFQSGKRLTYQDRLEFQMLLYLPLDDNLRNFKKKIKTAPLGCCFFVSIFSPIVQNILLFQY